MRKFKKLQKKFGLTYTRYSDDLTFSTRGDFSRNKARGFISEVSKILALEGFRPQHKKTLKTYSS